MASACRRRIERTANVLIYDVSHNRRDSERPDGLLRRQPPVPYAHLTLG